MKRGIIFLALIGALGTGWAAEEEYCTDGARENSPTTPENEFVRLGNGVIEHRETGLQWAQCAIGQTARGNACEGAATVFDWSEARDVVQRVNSTGELGGHTDWRLPTVEELATIIERCREAPAINFNVFPNTPWTGFWTSTLHFDGQHRVDDYDPEHVEIDAAEGAHDDDDSDREVYPEEAWFVGFYRGLEYPYDIASDYRVRLVRQP